jgi:predicted transposase YdaD
MKRKTDQYDSPWKEALEKYLRSIIEFCFPRVAAAINWKAPVEFLDQELQQIVRDAAAGQQRVDKLIRVALLSGEKKVILIHIEVQHQPDPKLPERVFQYNRRTRDRFGVPVLTLVILADENPTFRPDHFEEQLLECCRTRFDFPTCKLLDQVNAARKQIAARKPSAVIVVANWLAQQTRADMRRRLRVKWDLTRRLYEADYKRKDILELYRLIDWLLSLPPEFDSRFKEQVVEYETKKRMPYVTSIERLAKEEGLQEGLQEGLREGLQEGQLRTLRENLLETLEVRFGSVPQELKKGLAEITEVRRLKALHRLAITCANVPEFKRCALK